MNKTRLEAFSDGVIAIIITIMVLEMKVPHASSWAALAELGPVFLSYVLSFINVGVYWNNHHHMLHTVHRVSGGVLWANMHLLFWLSLVPFTTGWMGENHFAPIAVTVYAFNLTMCALAYILLQSQIIKLHGDDSVLALAVGNDLKGKVSLASYFIAMPLALVGYSWLTVEMLTLVSLIWFIPDRRIEKTLAH